jgi:hypothetical protein
MKSDDRQSALAIAQGVYFAATGIWPIVDMRSFEAVTGPKTDKWLVRTVGVLVAAIGGALIAAGARRAVTPEIAGLAIGSAAGLGLIDVIYSSNGRISKIYLADAAAEAAVIAAWTVGLQPDVDSGPRRSSIQQRR